MKQIDKVGAELIAKEIEAAVQAIGEKHGVTIRRGGGKFDSMTFNMKLTIKVADPEAALAAARADFTRNCFIFKLEASDFGRDFTLPGNKRYRVNGLALSRRKYPIKVWDYAKDQEVLMTEMIIPYVQAARPTA